MRVTIRDYELTFNSHKLYDVYLDDTEIKTVVTRDPGMVCTWINNTEAANASRLHRLIVGLDIEWEPNFYSQNPVATLQLCVGRSCLIYQILHAPSIPRLLRNFLQNEAYIFVGVGIDNDAQKLWDDYGLQVSNRVDLRGWAAEELENENLRNVGLKYLVKEIVGIEMEKPKSVTLSIWSERWLSYDQICYACLDAYLSFEVGRFLSSWYN
ncbi:PREDICTED: Werner Syndrome-like exonuclease [Nicotiana attenuata]|uniref:Werner syndrome-like exonuclease n=1 Tax=Nicotiana attenuata TaxID=49451 RepID=A0A314KN02_NICAT|nr:PREDICTED: Werner Syndrome-like exonuclease [Nicotiana attenuata]OIT30592.1 werner syndrome-like exonuclease [Nicotiana attenuata]